MYLNVCMNACVHVGVYVLLDSSGVQPVTKRVIRLIRLIGLQQITHYKIRGVIPGPEQRLEVLINGADETTFWLLDHERVCMCVGGVKGRTECVCSLH